MSSIKSYLQISIIGLFPFITPIFSQNQSEKILMQMGNSLATNQAISGKWQTTSEGVFFKGSGTKGLKPKQGQYISIVHKVINLDNKEVEGSTEDEPLVFQLGGESILLGIESTIPYFHKDEVGSLILPASMAYGNTGIEKMVKPGDPVRVDFKILAILNEQGYSEYMADLDRLASEKYQKKEVSEHQRNVQNLQSFARTQNIKVQFLQNGLGIAKELENKNARKITKGDMVQLFYKGLTKENVIFDQTNPEKPFVFEVGKGKVIQGWELGIQQFSKGEKGWLFIPSTLAYGGRPLKTDLLELPEFSEMIFQIEILP
jgi:FKBP-type peptidyl-prolyl cis-trans isomerase